VGSLVVAGCDSLEALLTSGIPDLKLDHLSVNFESTDLEVYTNSGHKVLCEDVILKIGVST
jgi:hypothetical protein